MLNFLLITTVRLLIVTLPFIITSLFYFPANPLIITTRVVTILLLIPIILVISLIWWNPTTWAFRQQAHRKIKDKISEHIWIEYSQISRVLKFAVLASEDIYFPIHRGFNWRQILEAGQHNQNNYSKRGGSTITQQLSKNLFLSPTKTYYRKLVEAYFTLLLEACLSKERILELYLNIIQFDKDIFGIETACIRFFQTHASEISQEQAVLLCSVIPNPIIYRVDKPCSSMEKKQIDINNNIKILTEDKIVKQQKYSQLLLMNKLPTIKYCSGCLNYNSREGKAIDTIILHYTACGDVTQAINWFKNPQSQVSAHYIIDKNGDIYQMVKDEYRAWHCRGLNINSIGIEHVADVGEKMTPAQEESSINLLRWLMSKYSISIDRVFGHRWNPQTPGTTVCPGSLWSSAEELELWLRRKVWWGS